MTARMAGALAAILLLSGCGDVQSVLAPRSPGAAEIATLWWIMFWTTGILASVVIAALLYAVVRARRAAADLEGTPHPSSEARIVLLAGTVIPTAVLAGFLVLTVRTGASVFYPPSEPELTVEVVGHQFWWEVRYPELNIVTANEIHIPADAPVEVRVTSADVIHSFWVPQLSPGKIDMNPGRWNRTWMMADQPGEYRGQCTEFCGIQHALMSLTVIAHSPGGFERWVGERSEPRPPIVDGEVARGRDLFFQEGCAACHAVREVSAPQFAGSPGPDLTHLASRATIGALTLPNTPENLASWIRDPHRFKEGVRMPSSGLDDEALQALVAFVGTLH